MKNIVIVGAGGRRGKTIIRCLANGAVQDLKLAGAVDIWDCPDRGKDAGLASGAAELGVKITTDLKEIIGAADAVIDFTSHHGTAGNAPRMAEWGKAWIIGTTGLGNVEGMDWDSNTNRMLISDFSSSSPSVYAINLTNASVQHVQTATSGGSYIRTLATRVGSSILDVRRETGGIPLQGDLQGSFDLSNGNYAAIGTSTAGIGAKAPTSTHRKVTS